MGNSASNVNFQYSTPVDPTRVSKGETPVYRHEKSIGLDLNKAYAQNTLHDLLKPRFLANSDKAGFCKRVFNKETKTLTSDVEWITNKKFRDQAEAFGSGLLNLKLVPQINEWKNMTLQFAGIYAKNSIEYLVMDVACIFYGITVVPIYDTLGEEATQFAFNQTKMETCVLTANHVAGLFKLKKEDNGLPYLRNLIVIDAHNLSSDLEESSRTNGIKLLHWDDVIRKGNEKICPWVTVTPDTIYCFSYTSGTTGEPKAAMMSHKNMSSTCIATNNVLKPVPGDVYLSYLPMAHVMERICIVSALGCEIAICMYGGDILKLKEDLAIFRPTIFVSVPRLFNKFYDAIINGLKEKSSLAKYLYGKGVDSKTTFLKHEGLTEHCFYDKLIFNKVKMVLGGRVRLMVTGSAPLAADVLDFLKIHFCCPVIEGYGQTEGSALEFNSDPLDFESGHVGGPALTTEFKLVDIPEMNYTSNDKDEFGQPAPRGEIWVRGPNVIPGYYKGDEKNLETFTSDGWLKSGDVGMIYSDKRRLKIIDRKKNIFKLSQGEYIAPEKLENIYKLTHTSVGCVYVYGDSFKSCLIGIVNVEKPALVKFAKEFGIEGDDAELLSKDPRVIKKYIELFDVAAKVKKLNSLEKLRDIYIETETFQNLGLLTEAFKVKRVNIKEHYKERLDEMYSKIN